MKHFNLIPMGCMNISIIILFFAGLCLMITACAIVPKSHLSLYQRSTIIETRAAEEEILSKAFLEMSKDPKVNHIKILYLKGTPYEMGFQHGRMIKDDVRASIYHVMRKIGFYAGFETMEEIYDLMEPYIPREEKEEMRGLAHGAGIPIKVVHWIHAIPEFSEYGPKKKMLGKLKQTSCSNLVAFGRAAKDQGIWQLRVLDWNRGLGVQKWPVILVHKPNVGNASVTFSYAGFIGALSGMNDQHMAFGEMGYGNPPGETLEGIPFVFLFRKIMREAKNLNQALEMVQKASRTCSYAYVVSDAKFKDKMAYLIVNNPKEVKFYGENTAVTDENAYKKLPAVENVVYSGADEEKLYQNILNHYGKINLPILMEISRSVARKSNIQNVIFNPETLESWVSNASNTDLDEKGKASNQKWFYFDFRNALTRY